MKWKDVFQDPDMVGQSEYLAIHDAIAMAVLGTTEPDPEQKIGKDEKKQIKAMLEEFQSQVGGLMDGLYPGMVKLSPKEIDWKMLRRQKCMLSEVLECQSALSPEFMFALSGILNLLDYLQDEAEKVMGHKAVFGKAKAV